MRTTSLIVLLTVAGCLIAFAAHAPLKPPVVTRGSPVKLSTEKLKPAPFKAKTIEKQIGVWFKENQTTITWYIDWDAERQPLRRIIVHHSATDGSAPPAEIESYTRRIYNGRYDLTETVAGGNDPYVKGLPIHSAHVVDGKERFITYHHLIYPDGKMTTELQPLIQVKKQWLIDMVGWHAGSWKINCESLGICLVGNYKSVDPPDPALKALGRLIAYYRTLEPKLVVEPHKQYRSTDCPGGTWDSWRKKIE